MRDAIIGSKLNTLRVNHDHTYFGRRSTHKNRHNHAVDGNRFTRARRTTNEQMGHSCQIANDAFTFHILANGNLKRSVRGIFQDITQKYCLAFFVGHFNTNVISTWNRSKDADTRRSKSERNIVSQIRNTIYSNT